MKLTLDTTLSPCHLTIEVDGVRLDTIVELDTETGRARRYNKHADGSLVREGSDLVIEEVVLPVDKLHVYLVKPK